MPDLPAPSSLPDTTSSPPSPSQALRSLSSCCYPPLPPPVSFPPPSPPLLPSNPPNVSEYTSKQTQSKRSFSASTSIPTSSHRHNSSVSSTNQPVSSRKPNLWDIISNQSSAPWTLKAFMIYLSHNHCLEMLEFIMDSSRYQNHYHTYISSVVQSDNPDSDTSQYNVNVDHCVIAHMKFLWTCLITAYIAPCATRELNLPSQARDELLLSIDSSLSSDPLPPHPTRLGRAVEKVYDLMNESVVVPFFNALSTPAAPLNDYNSAINFNNQHINTSPVIPDVMQIPRLSYSPSMSQLTPTSSPASGSPLLKNSLSPLSSASSTRLHRGHGRIRSCDDNSSFRKRPSYLRLQTSMSSSFSDVSSSQGTTSHHHSSRAHVTSGCRILSPFSQKLASVSRLISSKSSSITNGTTTADDSSSLTSLDYLDVPSTRAYRQNDSPTSPLITPPTTPLNSITDPFFVATHRPACDSSLHSASRTTTLSSSSSADFSSTSTSTGNPPNNPAPPRSTAPSPHFKPAAAGDDAPFSNTLLSLLTQSPASTSINHNSSSSRGLASLAIGSTSTTSPRNSRIYDATWRKVSRSLGFRRRV